MASPQPTPSAAACSAPLSPAEQDTFNIILSVAAQRIGCLLKGSDTVERFGAKMCPRLSQSVARVSAQHAAFFMAALRTQFTTNSTATALHKRQLKALDAEVDVSVTSSKQLRTIAALLFQLSKVLALIDRQERNPPPVPTSTSVPSTTATSPGLDSAPRSSSSIALACMHSQSLQLQAQAPLAEGARASMTLLPLFSQQLCSGCGTGALNSNFAVQTASKFKVIVPRHDLKGTMGILSESAGSLRLGCSGVELWYSEDDRNEFINPSGLDAFVLNRCNTFEVQVRDRLNVEGTDEVSESEQTRPLAGGRRMSRCQWLQNGDVNCNITHVDTPDATSASSVLQQQFRCPEPASANDGLVNSLLLYPSSLQQAIPVEISVHSFSDVVVMYKVPAMGTMGRPASAYDLIRIQFEVCGTPIPVSLQSSSSPSHCDRTHSRHTQGFETTAGVNVHDWPQAAAAPCFESFSRLRRAFDWLVPLALPPLAPADSTAEVSVVTQPSSDFSSPLLTHCSVLSFELPSRLLAETSAQAVPCFPSLHSSGVIRVSGLAISLNLRVAVIGYNDSESLIVFRLPTGHFKRAFGSKGEGPVQFSQRGQFCFTADQHLLIADRYNRRVQEVSVLGKFRRYLGQSLFTTAYPSGIAVHGMNCAVSCDGCSGSKVALLELSEGRVIMQFGEYQSTPGRKLGSLGWYCSCIQYSHGGSLLAICERNERRVSLFSSAGVFLRHVGIGILGSDPFTAGFTPDGDLAVSDSSHNQVCVFHVACFKLSALPHLPTASTRLSDPAHVTYVRSWDETSCGSGSLPVRCGPSSASSGSGALLDCGAEGPEVASAGGARRSFLSPSALCATATYFYIFDSGTNTVQVFRYLL